MRRSFWVRLHRWAGLAMAGFLVIVGLTGSVLAFREEVDGWLNPDLLRAPRREAPMLDPLELRERAQALFPHGAIDDVPLVLEPDRSIGFRVFHNEAGPSALTFVYLDPYSGEKLGERNWGEVSLARKDLVLFLYRLHYTLAFPGGASGVGRYILGVVALIWTIDCFVAFYLTLPHRSGSGSSARSAKSWWSRWRPAWMVKTTAGAYRITFDLHRAFGLWTSVMLLVFAWSSVGFNLPEVYTPTMRVLFGLSQEATVAADGAARHDLPRLGWREAREMGRALLREQAGGAGVAVAREKNLSLDRGAGVFTLSAEISHADGSAAGGSVTFDAATGELRRASSQDETPQSLGDVIDRWLVRLHTAAVFGRPYKAFVSILGLIVVMLSITGVCVWWKKRRARVIGAPRRSVERVEV